MTRLLKVRNVQDAALPLIRLLLNEGKGFVREGRTRIVLPTPVTLLIEHPLERAYAFPIRQPNPFVRMAQTLLTHSRMKNQKLVEQYEADELWDCLPAFEPRVTISDQRDEWFAMAAAVGEREIVADLLSRDLLELSVMQELMAGSYAPAKPLGHLAVELTAPYLDVDAHVPFIKMLEAKDHPPDIYHNARPLPLVKVDRSCWAEEAEIVLRPEVPSGLREPWHRRVSVPMLAAFRCYREGDARWKLMLDEIADPAWRASARAWIEQDLEKPDTRPRR